MSNVIIDREKIDILANAISDKSGVPVTMTLAEMVEAVDGIETGGGEPNLQAKTYTVDSAGTSTVTADSGYDGLSSVSVSVPQADFAPFVHGQFDTQSGERKWHAIGGGYAEGAGWVDEGAQTAEEYYPIVPANTSVTPTESSQTIGGWRYMMESAVTVNAIPSNYVGSGIPRRTASDLAVIGAYVSVPAGFYDDGAGTSVASGTAGTPTATKGTVSNHSVSVTPSVTNTAGYITGGTKNGTAVTVSASELVSGTYTVDSSGTKDVTNYASASVPAGTAGTPSASKGAVSNHSISVTPSVTNTTGYITGGTKTGTAVSVSAAELVSGNKAISANGTNIDVTNYATVSVAVDTVSNQDKSVTPTESEQEITADSGYTGLGTVTVEAISSTYVGSGITARSSSDLTTSGATVTVPAGYYASQATKSVSSGSATGPSSLSGSSATITTGTNTITLTKTGVTTTPTVSAGYVSSATASTATVALTASVTVNPTPTASGATVTIPTGYYSAQTTKSVTTMTLPTSAAASATSGYTKKATISRSTSTQYINIAPGYNSAGGYYEISAVANGSAKGPSSLSGSSATVSTGTNTLTLTKTGVTTTPTVTAGYVSSATASTATVTLTASVTTKVAATITPTTTNQTIAAGTYLTGTQTIAGDADLIASNIKKDVNIFGVTGTYDPTDFIINLTQDSSNKWIPDCTFAEAEAALNSGKALKFVAEYPAGDAYFAGYDDFGKTIAYGVIENTSTLNGAVLIDKTFIYDVANTVTQDLTFTYYETAQATAQASDVVSTKTFFNGSGYQTGTLDLTDVYIRSTAPTSSVGSNGDIYIQE